MSSSSGRMSHSLVYDTPQPYPMLSWVLINSEGTPRPDALCTESYLCRCACRKPRPSSAPPGTVRACSERSQATSLPARPAPPPRDPHLVEQTFGGQACARGQGFANSVPTDTVICLGTQAHTVASTLCCRAIFLKLTAGNTRDLFFLGE